MNPIPVLGIEEIAFEVQDIEQSVAFYRDIIGLELLSRGPQQAWFRVGAQRLALFTRDRAGSGQHFAFRIPADMAEQVRTPLCLLVFPRRLWSKTTACLFMCVTPMETRSNCMAGAQRSNQSLEPTVGRRDDQI
jgi:Glyoxalase/Bleomycin resistance protein/Dioxygenase superfamily